MAVQSLGVPLPLVARANGFEEFGNGERTSFWGRFEVVNTETGAVVSEGWCAEERLSHVAAIFDSELAAAEWNDTHGVGLR